MKYKLTLLIALTLLVSFTVNASELPTVYYFDMECYDAFCTNNTLIFNNKTNTCIFEPILLDYQSMPFGDNVRNKDEYLQLDNKSREIVRKIYWDCTKVNSTATAKLQDETLRERNNNLMRAIFRLFILPLLIVVAIVGGVYLIWKHFNNLKK